MKTLAIIYIIGVFIITMLVVFGLGSLLVLLGIPLDVLLKLGGGFIVIYLLVGLLLSL